AGEPHRLYAMPAQRREQRDVELARVYHGHDLERRVVGDAPTGHQLRLVAEAPAESGRLIAAAVHHDHADAERGEQPDLGDDAVQRVAVRHQLASQLDHEYPVAIRAHVAQRALQPGDAFGRLE